MSTMISEPMTYVAAFSSPPAIKCPDWCTVPLEDHLSRLRDLEGFVIHHSAEHGVVRHSSETYVDGTPDPEGPPLIYVNQEAADGIGLEQAEALAHEILAAVKEARA